MSVPVTTAPAHNDNQNPYCDNINTKIGKNNKLTATKYTVCMLTVLNVATSTPAQYMNTKETNVAKGMPNMNAPMVG